jgi:hypothetical protein
VSGRSVVCVLSESHLISVCVIEVHPKGDDETEERIKSKWSRHCFLGGSRRRQGGQSNLDLHQGTEAKSQGQAREDIGKPEHST